MSPYGHEPPGEPEFALVVDEYERFRSGYADAVYDHLAAQCGLVAGAVVVDVGCGTGLATAALVERGARVVGIDLDADMLERATAHLGDRARLLVGRAEHVPLDDASADLVIAAQAAHWFDEPAASRELRRVLRPGGSLAYIWKYPAPETPYAYVVDEIVSRMTGYTLKTVYGVGTVGELCGDGFTDYRRAVFEQPITYTVEGYVGFQASRERIRQVTGDHHGAFLAEVTSRLSELVPAGSFVERNLAYVVSARKRSS